jgi:hypothetical protein
MTGEQIIWEITRILGAIVLTAILTPLLKQIWQRINRPAPLTPQEKGQLATRIDMNKLALARLRRNRSGVELRA